MTDTDDLVRRLREHDGHLGYLVEEAADEIERLRATVRLLGEIANACTFDDLGEVCSMCRCSRRPVSPAERA